MGIFDIDSGADNHLLNEQFHVFSKSPASVNTSLGVASNRSGHTVTSSDVWGQEIPAFFAADDMTIANTYNAKKNDLCRIGNSVAIFKDGAWSIEYASYTDIPDGHVFLNANDEPVVRFHKNRVAHLLNLKNNANDDGQQMTAKIQGWDETANDGQGAPYEYVETAPKFVSQFVTSTDKIIDGVPSKGYGPFVIDGTKSTTGDITKVLNEGTVDSEHYVANSFAGIIQYNRKRSEATYVHAFEYCGKTLSTAVSDIAELDEKLSKISVTAAGGVQALSDAAKAAGLEIDSVVVEGVTTPTLDLSTATITDGIFASTTGNKAKLVTAADVESYVSKNAKVSVNGQSATTITVAGTPSTSDDIVKVVVTEDKSTTDKIGLTLTATIDKAVFNDDGSLAQDGIVIASIAQDIADAAIESAITDTTNGAIAGAISDAIEDATLNSGTQGDNQIQNASGDAAGKLVTAAQVKEYVTENAQVTVTVGTTKKTSTGFEFAGSTGTDITVAPTMDANGKVTYAATLSKATVNASTGAITNGSLAVSATDAKTIVDKAIEAAVADGSTIDTRIDEVITTAVADGGTIDNRIDTLISNATSTSAIVDNDTSTKLVTASQVATYVASEVGAIDTGILGVNTNVRPEGVNGLGSLSGITLTETADNKVKLSINTALEGQSLGGGSETWNGTFANAYALTTGEQVQSIAKYEATKVGITDISYLGDSLDYLISISDNDNERYLNITGAGYYKKTETSEGSWGNSYGLVTGHTLVDYVGDETAKTLEAAKAYSDSLHTTSLDYVVLGDSESLPTASADTLGKIYLVKEGNTANGENNIDAISGSYVEYMTRKIGDGASATYAWEKIGTTAADLSGYAKTVTINGQTYNVTANTVALGTGFANKVASGQATSLANQLSVYANIATDGTLTLGVDDASTTGKGLVQLASNVSSNSALVPTAKAVKDYADTKVRSVTAGSGDALTGLSVSVGGTATAPEISVTNGVINSGSLPATANVVANGLIDGTDVIETEKINFGEGFTTYPVNFTLTATQLTTWVGDMPNLQSGYNMFSATTAIETFCGDLSSLACGYSMFNGCAKLTSFTSDLSSLTDGSNMFIGCKLDAESLECIADTINDVRSLQTSVEVTKEISIYYNCSAAAAQAAYDTITGKGWSCTMTYNA